MDPRYFTVWPVFFFTLFSLSPAGPTGQARNDPQDTELLAEYHVYGPHTGDDHHDNRIKKLDTDPDSRDEVIPRIRHRSHDGSNHDTGNDELWSRIEHRVLRHLRQTEEKMMEHMEEKTNRLNQSVTVNYLYKVYHYIIEEIEIGKQIGEMRAGEIEKVRKIALDQDKEILKLENTVDALKAMVDNLTSAVEEMRLQGSGRRTSRPDSGMSPAGITGSPAPVIKPKFPVDCQEVYQLGGMKYEGDYFMKIQPYLSLEPFEAACRMSHNAGWTVIQRRMDGLIDFYRNWDSYRQGFGDVRGSFWLGNDKIYQLTNQGDYMLRIEMTDFDGRNHYAEYAHFRVLNEDHHYKMHVHGYHGDAGDSLTPDWNNHDGQPFSTYDRDHDDRFYDNCAERFHGAWWFKSCFESHLNGLYYNEGSHDNYFKQNGIQWNTVGHHYSLRSVVMMVKPNKNVIEKNNAHDDHISNDIQ